MDRLTAHNISVVEITLNTRIESVSYSSDAPFDPAREPKLQAVERALGSNVSVQSVVVPVHSHSPLTCDFRNATTNGKTNALYPLGELIRLSLALLTAMSGEEASRVNSLAAEQPMTVDDPQATLDFE
jgi:hypothetical protein